MLQRLKISLGQVKAGSNLDKFFISCINRKKLIKKVYNNIIKPV